MYIDVCRCMCMYTDTHVFVCNLDGSETDTSSYGSLNTCIMSLFLAGQSVNVAALLEKMKEIASVMPVTRQH